MRIECPSCQAVYEVPDALLTGGPRLVRCARCAKDWQPTPMQPDPPATASEPAPPQPPQAAAPATPTAVPKPEPGVPPAPPPPRPARPPTPLRPIDGPRIPTTSPRPAGRAKVVMAWLLSVAALAALGWAGYAYRADLIAAWPPITRLYALLGLLP